MKKKERLCKMLRNTNILAARNILKLLGVETKFYDFHSHTNIEGSDGKFKPKEQVEYAYKRAYNIFCEQVKKKVGDISEKEIKFWFETYCKIYWGITDHNTAMAFEELRNQNFEPPKNMIILTGIEIEAIFPYDGQLCDILIYGIGREFLQTKMAKNYLENVVAAKNDLEDRSAEIQYQAFFNMGIEIPELMDQKKRYRMTGERANDLAEGIIRTMLFEKTEDPKVLNFRSSDKGKLAIEYLLNCKYDPEKGRATYYRHFITNSDSLFYVDQAIGRWNVEGVFYEAMKQGYTVIIAHPGIYNGRKLTDFLNKIDQTMRLTKERLKEKTGIDISGNWGFECGHREMSLKDAKEIKDFCKGKGLLYSASSDFHNDENKAFYTSTERERIKQGFFQPKMLNLANYCNW